MGSAEKVKKTSTSGGQKGKERLIGLQAQTTVPN